MGFREVWVRDLHLSNKLERKAEPAWCYWESPPEPITAFSVCLSFPGPEMGMSAPEAHLGDKSIGGLCTPGSLTGGSYKL